MTTMRARADQLAYLVSTVASPFVIFPLLIVAASAGAASTFGQFAGWAGILLATTGLIPALYILWGVRTGQISDVHIMVREQRAMVFLVFLLSAAAGMVILRLYGAPTTMFLLALIAFSNGLLAALITLVWKVSIHSWVYAGAATAFALLVNIEWGWWWLIGLPLVIWSRVYRGRHTVAQGILGGVLGVALTYGLYRMIFR